MVSVVLQVKDKTITTLRSKEELQLRHEPHLEMAPDALTTD
jgi:hypothetical protein